MTVCRHDYRSTDDYGRARGVNLACLHAMRDAGA
jgi:hypothetical protein